MGRDGHQQPHQVDQQRHRPGNHEGCQGGQGGQQGLAFIGQHAQFFDHHRIDPALCILALDLDQLFGVLLAVSPAAVEHKQLGPLAFGEMLHLPALALPFALVIFLLAFDRKIGPDAHRKAIREQVGQAQDEHHVGAQRCPSHAADHGKGGDDPIQAAVHQLTQVLAAGAAVLLLGNVGQLVGFRSGALVTLYKGPAGFIQSFRKAHRIDPRK